jgi:hypothetical protein
MSDQAKRTTSELPELDAHWLEATADEALSAIEGAGRRALELVEQWIQRGNAAAVADVALRGEGAVRKAARRGLNVLKARGVAIPEQRKVSPLAGAKGQANFEAWMMPPDATGSLLLVIASRLPTSRYKAAFTFLHDAVGILRIELAEVSQSGLRDAFKRVMPGAEHKPVKVPVAWARARVAGARQQHAQTGAPEPLGMTNAASLLEPVPEKAPPHPFDEEGLELSDDDASDLVKSSAGLHRLPEFRSWLPTREAVDELLQKLGETLTPGQQPDSTEMAKRLEEEIQAATDRYFSPQKRLELVTLMKDAALSVLIREGEVRALEVVAAMKVIERAGLITDPPREVPFLRAFFEKAMSLLIAQGGGQLRVPVPQRPAEMVTTTEGASGQDAPEEP